jgi:hypothetical protein
MAIQVTCDGCFMEYTVSDGKAGKAFRCKECGGAVRVPREGAETSGSRSATSAPQPQRRPAAKRKKSAAKGKKSSRPSLITGPFVPLLLGLAVLAGVGVGGYLLFSGGDRDVALESLSVDEQAVVEDVRQMVRAHSDSTPEQREAAMASLAAEHQMTPEDVRDIVGKYRQAQQSAAAVETNWKPLSIAPGTHPAWPTEVQISLPTDGADTQLQIPAIPAPFLIATKSETREGDFTSP